MSDTTPLPQESAEGTDPFPTDEPAIDVFGRLNLALEAREFGRRLREGRPKSFRRGVGR